MRAASLVLAVAAIAGVPRTPSPWIDGSPPGTIAAVPRALTTSSISNPYCRAVDLDANRCAINVRSIVFGDNGTASPYLASANISIDGHLRLRVNTFFENTIDYYAHMVPHGLGVDCGLPNEGGLGDAYGKVHVVAIEPIDATGATMGGNSANVPCPAAIPPTTTTTSTTSSTSSSTSTTSSSVPTTSSTTSTSSSTTSSTTTSTTLSPCASASGVARARCELSAALEAPLCGAVTIPPAVDRRLRAGLGSADALLQKATAAAGRRLTRLLTRARRALDGASAFATRATKAKKPSHRLASECAATIADLVAAVEQFLPAP